MPAAAAGGVTGVASAVDGISGAAASAVTTALLAASVIQADGTAFPAAADYSRAWLMAAAAAAAGALVTAIGAVRFRR